ncbi:hypothetical protein F5X68DRAFT_187471 [Plectosphaerella plurivora]|uniref:Uncharacterized protein n=1 Tax=Plectosphaerella plurivora TaxID=936078 RepID=A0A9P8VK54_9PEZI|nr:hypothetical protein F5X68DRAFT_187471 [Plectosphaerella plurivora]
MSEQKYRGTAFLRKPAPEHAEKYRNKRPFWAALATTRGLVKQPDDMPIKRKATELVEDEAPKGKRRALNVKRETTEVKREVTVKREVAEIERMIKGEPTQGKKDVKKVIKKVIKRDTKKGDMKDAKKGAVASDLSGTAANLALTFSSGVPDITVDQLKDMQRKRDLLINELIDTFDVTTAEDEERVVSNLRNLRHVEESLMMTITSLKKRQQIQLDLQKRVTRASATKHEVKQAEVERDEAIRERDAVARELALMKRADN